MRWKTSYTVVVAILALLAVYFLVRGGLARPARPEPTTATAKAKVEAPLVQVALIDSVDRPYAVSLRGRTEARRAVSVRSETAGPVARTPVLQGSFVRKGQVLCQLSVDSRQAALDQARAALKARQLTQQASIKLAESGYRSPTQVLQDQAGLDAATAAVRQAQVGMEQIYIRAPFDGVFDHRDAEIGTYLAPGQACGEVIELTPLLVVGDISEDEVSHVAQGADAVARLASGETISGKVRYVARSADATTRTYRVEIETPNPGATVRAGVSAEVRIISGRGPAHLAPVSALVLDAAGRQGVRQVGADGRVVFSPVRVLEETAEGVWLAGLTGPVRLITVGQSYVAEGQTVRVATAGAPR